MKRSVLVVATTLFLAPLSMQSQAVQFDSTPARIANDLRKGKIVEIAMILMQDGGPSRRTKGAIADSAVSVVLGRSAKSGAPPQKSRVISGLGLAARSTTDGASIAFDALRRIAFQSTSERDGLLATHQIGRALDVSAVVEALAIIAVSPDGRAGVAIDGLRNERIAEGGGLAALQRLWEGALVSDRFACEGLREIAYRYKWKATSQTSCRNWVG